MVRSKKRFISILILIAYLENQCKITFFLEDSHQK